MPDRNEGKCALKSCEELLYSDCYLYKPIGEGADVQNCIGESQCELKKCHEMDSNRCYEFETKSNDYRCLQNKNGDGCERKTCTELEGDRCFSFFNEDEKHICMPNENENGCEYNGCNDLKPNDCSNYGLVDEQNRICLETDDKKGCEYRKCEDLSPPSCQSYPSIDGFKCIEDNGKCFYRQCSDYRPPNCGNFESDQADLICDIDPENDNSCIERPKKCEEYPYLLCENFNSYNYGEKCVQKKDKTGCELISCTKMAINECGNFIPEFPDGKCTLNAAGNKCEIKDVQNKMKIIVVPLFQMINLKNVQKLREDVN